MRTKFYSLITLPSLFFITSAFSGTPTLSNKCYVGLVKHPKNSMGIAFDEECSNAYVLPPEVGKVSVTAVQQNMNLGFCKTFNLVSETEKESESNRLEITKTITKMIKDYEPFKKEVDQLYLEMKKNESTFNAIKEQLDLLKIKDQKNQTEIAQAVLAYNQIISLNPNSQEAKSAYLVLEGLRNNYREFLKNEYYPIQSKYLESELIYSVSKDKYNYEQNKYAENLKPLYELQKLVDDLAQSAMKSYERYSMLEGLTAQLLFNPSNSDIIQQYIELNPSLNHVTWQNMQIKDAVFYASRKDATGEADPTYRALIDAIIPGMKFQNVKNFDTTLPSPSLKEEVSTEKTAFGSTSGRVRLNLLGACAYFEDVNKPIPDKDINDISANLILRANYTFQLKARRSFTATYNLFNMFSRIERTSSSRGWFSTSSVHSIVEDNKSEDWFSIKFDGDAAEFGYTPQEQKEIEQDEKALLIDRALRQFAMVNAGSTPPGLMPPPVSGIMYASNRLNLCNHFYCQVGSFVLGTIGSLFGGSNAASEFQKKTNVWSRDSVNGYQIIDRTNQITFSSN